MRRLPFWMLLMLVVLGTVRPAAAVITNPDPALFNEDDGGQLFLPMDRVLSAEIFDLGGIVGDSEFGFFFANAPTILIPIFQADDQRPPQQWATIDFDAGEVWDGDLGTFQNSFEGFGSIGFYLWVTALPGEDFLAFSVPSMNEDGLDLFASFPSRLFDTGYLLAFKGPNERFPVSFHATLGITKVPIPATSFLMLTGLTALATFRRRQRN